MKKRLFLMGIALMLSSGYAEGAMTGIYVANGRTITLEDQDIEVPDILNKAALWAFNGGQITMTGGTIHSLSGWTGAVESNSNSMIELNDVEISTGPNSNGEFSDGLWANGGAIVMNGGSIKINQLQSNGVSSTNGGMATLNNVAVTVNGDSGGGVTAGENGQLNMTGGSIIMTGNSSSAVKVRYSGQAVLKDVAIQTEKESSEGAYVDGTGILTLTGGSLNILGDDSQGIRVTQALDPATEEDHGTVNLDGTAITINGKNSDGILADRTGTAKLKNATIEVLGEESYALRAAESGIIQGEESKHLITGNIAAKSGGEIDYTLGEGSVFTGTANQYAGDGTIDLKMKSNSIWNMTGDWDANLTMEQGGHLYFHNTDFMRLSGDGTVTIDGGTIHFDTNIEEGTGDYLTVEKGIQGSGGYISVDNDGSAVTNGTEILGLLADREPDQAVFQLSQGKVEAGGYEYVLDQRLDSAGGIEWFLRGTGEITPPGEGGVNLHAGNYMMHNAELQTLMNRLGDLRGEKERTKGGNIWGRMYGGKLHSKADRTLGSFDMNYRGIQVGADHRHNRKDGKGTAYIGGFFGYTDGDLDYLGGSGNTDSFSLGAYWTHIHRNGFYADLVFKYGWMESDYDVLDSAGKKVEGKDIQSDVFSLSMELGRRYHFDQQKREGFYIEPQAQVTVSHFSGDSFKASNGLQLKVDSFRSTIARVGTHLGYEVTDSKNPVNIYLKGYLMKEFDGKIDFSLNGSPESTSYQDTWFVYGIGATAKLGERHNLYLDFEKWTGGRMEQDWAINGGYRYSW